MSLLSSPDQNILPGIHCAKDKTINEPKCKNKSQIDNDCIYFVLST